MMVHYRRDENGNIILSEYMFNRLMKITHNKEKENKKLNNIVNDLKLCNSDYYNQICTLTSKISLINKYISNSEQELSVDSYYKFKDLSEFDDIKNIIFDKNIKLGSDK